MNTLNLTQEIHTKIEDNSKKICSMNTNIKTKFKNVKQKEVHVYIQENKTKTTCFRKKTLNMFTSFLFCNQGILTIFLNLA